MAEISAVPGVLGDLACGGHFCGPWGTWLVREIFAVPGNLRDLTCTKNVLRTWGLSVPGLCGKFSWALGTWLVAGILAVLGQGGLKPCFFDKFTCTCLVCADTVVSI